MNLHGISLLPGPFKLVLMFCWIIIFEYTIAFYFNKQLRARVEVTKELDDLDPTTFGTEVNKDACHPVLPEYVIFYFVHKLFNKLGIDSCLLHAT